MELDDIIDYVIDDLIEQLDDAGFELTELQEAVIRRHKRQIEKLYDRECERRAMSQYAGDGSD